MKMKMLWRTGRVFSRSTTTFGLMMFVVVCVVQGQLPTTPPNSTTIAPPLNLTTNATQPTTTPTKPTTNATKPTTTTTKLPVNVVTNKTSSDITNATHGHVVVHSTDFCKVNKNRKKDIYERTCTIQDDDLLWFFLSLFVIIVWGALIRTILKATRLNIPYTVILMITGLLLGSGTHINMGVCSTWSKFTKIARIPPKNILYTFLPPLIFESAYNMDVHVFMRSLSQILVLALPGMILSVFLTGFVCVGFMTTYGWDYPTAFLYGSIISATDPVAVVAILKELGTSKKLGILIEGESLLNDGVAVLMYEIFIKIVGQEKDIILEVVKILLKVSIGGPLFGYVVGKICTVALAMIFNDAATEITITIFSSYLVYALAEQLGISGVISVVVLGLKMSADSTSISPEVLKNVHQFWEMVGYLANTVIFVLVGIILSETAIGQINSLDAFNLGFLYLNLTIVRLATLMLLMPWLTRIGYGLKWQDMLVSTWGGLRGAVGLCLALEVFYSSELCQKPGDQIGPKILFHTGGIVFLTLFLNGTTAKTLLDWLHLTDVSSGRLQDMHNAVKQVGDTKERATFQYRYNVSFVDADWTIVNKNTKIYNPYKVKTKRPKSAEKSHAPPESDASSTTENVSLEPVAEDVDETAAEVEQPMRLRFQTEREDSEGNGSDEKSHTSSKELAFDKEVLEAEESRQRIMKALKVSFWRQYEKGVLSDVAVQILIGVADRAGDLQLHMIHARDFERYYVIHGFFHWIQKNFIERFKLDKELVLPDKPKTRWRQKLWWLATREWFNGIVTIVVLVSLIPAIWEFVLEHSGANNEERVDSPRRIAFLITSAVFIIIYLIEFFIKIFGFGVRGYFGDKWNWVDVVILVMGIVNVTFSVAFMFAFVGKTENNITTGLSLVTRAFRVFKLTRSLRLLKCCVRRGRGFMHTRMNHSIFLGYDIGTGFVKGVDDVIKFLPQMTEHEKVKIQLVRALRTERLETIRLLGRLQQKHPKTAIAVKTRHASRAVLNEMRGTLYELREDGLLDIAENALLLQLIESKMKFLWSTPVSVLPNSPTAILHNLAWLHAGDDPRLASFIQENSVLLSFPEGHTLYNVGDEPNGIYLIVEGMVKVHYMPDFKLRQEQLNCGKLPNIEVLGDMMFELEDTDYLQVGYAIGEFGVLTKLPSSCTVTCETPVRVYHIPPAVMADALKQFDLEDDGLESRIWRSVGMRIAEAIFQNVDEYQSWTNDRIRTRVEHSAVPIGEKFENMTVPEYICDIVLLQGVIQDGNTKNVYTAPCLLPRSCKKLSKVPNSPLPARFLLIAEPELEDMESDDDDDADAASVRGSVLDKSVHKLVVKASHVSSDTSMLFDEKDERFAKNVRQRNLLKKLQLKWRN